MFFRKFPGPIVSSLAAALHLRLVAVLAHPALDLDLLSHCVLLG